MLMVSTSQKSGQGPTRTHQEICHPSSYKCVFGVCAASVPLKCPDVCVIGSNVLLRCVLLLCNVIRTLVIPPEAKEQNKKPFSDCAVSAERTDL